MKIIIRIPDQRVDSLFKLVETSACGCDPLFPCEEKERRIRDGILRELHTNVYVAIKRRRWHLKEKELRSYKGVKRK